MQVKRATELGLALLYKTLHTAKSTVVNMRIRAIESKDFLPLSRFFARNDVYAVTRKFNPFPLTEETAYRITQKFHKDRYYLAYIGEEVVGLVMLRGWDEGYQVPSFGVLVDREHYNQGIGKRLTLFALAEARNLGCKKVRLSVYASNAIALRLYLSLGFREISRAVVFIDGESDTKIVMEKELEP